MRYYTHFICVEGRNDFPMDMLRYDNCVPATERDANILVVFSRKARISKRRILLRMYRPNPYMQPTAGRWSSFSWEIIAEGRTLGELRRKLASRNTDG